MILRTTVTIIPLILSFGFAACGDDGGNTIECGDGTVENEGVCVPVLAGNGPADRRVCAEAFGPVGTDALLVDATYDGGEEDGSLESPFTNIQSAIDAATAGQEIGIAPGTYVGDLTINKALSLEGRCADEVIVGGTIHVENTGGVGVRGLTVQDGSPGILADDVQPVGDAEYGLQIRFVRATTNIGAGIEMNASAVEIRDCEILQTVPRANSDLRELGSGVFVNDGSFFNISTSVVNMNGFMGIDVADATGLPTAVADTGVSKATSTSASTGVVNMNGIIGNAGGGVRINGEPSGAGPLPDAALVQVIANDFESNKDFAILASSSRVDVLGNTIVGIPESHSAVRFVNTAGAISANTISDFPKGAIALQSCVGVGITANMLMNNSEVGVSSMNSDGVSITGNRIEGTKVASDSTPFASGHGIFIGAADISTAGRHDINANTIADNGGVGVAIDNLDIGNTERVMFSMLNNGVSRNGYAGITLDGTRHGEIFGNTLTDNVGFGLRCNDGPGQDARIYFDRNTVIGTTFSTTPNMNGHAVVIRDCHISVDENTIEQNAQYGMLFDIASDGGCDDNLFSGHVEDIVFMGNPPMGANNNVDTMNGPVTELDVLAGMIVYDQETVMAPRIEPGL